MSEPWEEFAAAAPPADGPWAAFKPEPEPPKAIEVPDRIPQAMEDRLVAGHEARQREGGLINTIPQGIDLMSTPEGRTRLWEAVKKYPSKLLDDTINMAKLPGDVMSGKVDLSTEEGLEQAIGLGMLIAGSRLNKLSTTGKTSGLAVSMGEPVSRISKGPMGEIYDLPIGTAARSEDFAAAAEIVGGGRSIEAFHGSAKEFSSPDVAFGGSRGGVEGEKGAMFFSPTRDLAEKYGDNVITKHIDLSKSAEFDVDQLVRDQEFRTEMRAMLETEARRSEYLKERAKTPEGQAAIERRWDTIVEKIDRRPDSRPEHVRYDAVITGAIIQRARDDGLHVAVVKNMAEGRGKAHDQYIVLDNAAMLDAPIDTAPMAVQEKLLAAYEEKGLHPSEVAHDAQSDPIVAQQLLSSDKGVLPPGEPPPRPPEPPKPPSEPPAPPPEGSFEAAQSKILNKISVGETAPKEGWSWNKFYRQAIDDLHPLKAADEDAYQLARLTRGQFGKAEHFIEHGTFDFETYKTNGKPLAEIIEPVAKDLDGFRAYLASKRALEIEATGRKSGMDIEAAQRVATEGEGKYGKAAAELQGYQENLLAYLRDSGVISGDAFTAMREAGQNYVPFYRVFEPESGAPAGKGFGPGSPIKKLKGSERDIVDPLESIVKNTYAFISVAERNAVGIKLIDALKEQGEKVTTGKLPRDAELVDYLKEQGVTEPEKLADFVASTAREEGDTLSAWRDGKREQVKVKDPELVAAFRNLDQGSADMLVRVLAAPAKLLRAGATLSPDFIVRNVVRDFMTAFVNSSGALFSPIDTVKGLVGVIRKDIDFQNWMKGGGANATMVSLDRRYLQESLSKLNGETGLMERSWNVVTSPIRGLRLVSELAENATRLAEFKKMTGEGKAAIQSAAFASREVTLDFARIGASMRAYNMIAAFGNAQIQGLDRIGRAFVDRPVNTTAKVAGGITLPSVLLWWANHDDPRYKELPNWQKDMFWIVMTKDHIFRIPKPFELGVVFGSGVERILDATVGQNKEAFDGLGKSIAQVIMPNYVPTAAQPLMEQWANRSSMSDRTLIPADMEKFLPEYQYTPYTTELAKKLGQVVSAFPGMRSTAVGPGAPFGPIARAVTSPILLENYVRAWTGGLGVYAMQAADASLRKTGVLPDPVTPTPTLSDIPVVKAFMVRYPSASTQSIQDFYDQHETTKRYYDTWLAKAKEGDTEAMARIQSAGGPMMFVRLDAIKETLSDHSKLVRDIYKNPTVKPEEKRQLIDGLYYNMIEIAKGGKSMQKDVINAVGAQRVQEVP